MDVAQTRSNAGSSFRVYHVSDIATVLRRPISTAGMVWCQSGAMPMKKCTRSPYIGLPPTELACPPRPGPVAGVCGQGRRRAALSSHLDAPGTRSHARSWFSGRWRFAFGVASKQTGKTARWWWTCARGNCSLKQTPPTRALAIWSNSRQAGRCAATVLTGQMLAGGW